MKSVYGLVGMQYRGMGEFVASLPNGEPLKLIREPDNPYDRNAIQVWARDKHVGYVKGSQVRPLAMAMDAAPDKPLTVKLAVNGGRWPLVEIEDQPTGDNQ